MAKSKIIGLKCIILTGNLQFKQLVFVLSLFRTHYRVFFGAEKLSYIKKVITIKTNLNWYILFSVLSIFDAYNTEDFKTII